MLKRTIRLAAVTTALALAAALSSTALADHSWNDYHIARTANPFIIQYVDSVNSVWDGVLVEAVQRWGQSSVLEFDQVGADDGDRTRRRCPMISGQMRVCNAAYGQNGWLGLATIGLDSQGHIDQGTAQMNDSYDWYWTPEEMNHVMCQEIGHVFGLDHTSEDGSSQGTCMDYSTDPSSQWPNAHDYDMIEQIYAHLDSYNSFTSSGGDDGGDKPCNAPPGKGCNKFGANVNVPMGLLVHSSRHHEVYVASRPDGGYWVHHVVLAPEPGKRR
ncbi:MAG TPA: matrixin family metalloprotease [Gammaproteobacteria bacterium]